jgi:hypothetical protein
MITKWFLGVSAKSKGFITGWKSTGRAYYNNCSKAIDTRPIPSFTKQSALATAYETEADAIAERDKYIKDSKERLVKAQARLTLLKEAKSNWSNMSFDDKVDFCIETGVGVPYKQQTSWNNRIYHTYIKFTSDYKGKIKRSNFNDDEIKAIHIGPHFNSEIECAKSYVKRYKNEIDFCNTKMIVREQEIEIKFVDKERRSISWSNRSDTDTCGNYCNCCGGAVPGVPQLRISGRKYGETTFICGICMAKLADESKMKVQTIPNEIMEHYQTDRFLRAMD